MRNIIITGGELFNKGAQAMTFVAVDELKKRFPDHEIYLLSEMDKRRKKEEKEQYAFQFTGWYPIKFARAQQNPVLRMACMLRNRAEFTECEHIYRNCDLMVDISGYGLGSNWGINQITNYLDHLEFAKQFFIPCYLLPQSFGPFDFDESQKVQGDRVQELLQNVRIIAAREQDGYNALKRRYNLNNVCLKPDLVLNNRNIDVNHIYKTPPSINVPRIAENSVGVIPNEKVTEEIGIERTKELYSFIISVLLQLDKQVIIISHASSDESLCLLIKALFSDEKRVAFLDREYNCLEFSEIVSHFQFVIASRYHSIVHAYKNNIPCIAIGWAIKYREILHLFNQDNFLFDVQDPISEKQLYQAIHEMEVHREENKFLIQTRLEEIQKENVFDIIQLE